MLSRYYKSAGQISYKSLKHLSSTDTIAQEELIGIARLLKYVFEAHDEESESTALPRGQMLKKDNFSLIDTLGICSRTLHLSDKELSGKDGG